MELRTGVILNGKYRIVKLVDERGAGAVYEGRAMRGDGRVAIKVLRRKFAGDNEWIARFEREGEVARRISSPRLARAIEVGELPDRRRYMVMEYLAGEKLSTRMEREGRIAPHVMVDLVVQLLEALQQVHGAGVVHRGISPHNVFLQQMGRLDFVCLLDFGVCKDMTDKLRAKIHTTAGRLLASVAYSAPETLEAGFGRADPRSDLFSVGVLLYRGIAALSPFPAREPDELVQLLREGPAERLSDVVSVADGALSDIVQRALAYQPRARFQTAGEMSDALVDWQAEHETKKRNVAPAKHPPPGFRKRAPAGTLRLKTSELQHLKEPGSEHDTITTKLDVDAMADEPTASVQVELEEPTVAKQPSKNPPPKLSTGTVRMSIAPQAQTTTPSAENRGRRR